MLHRGWISVGKCSALKKKNPASISGAGFSLSAFRAVLLDDTHEFDFKRQVAIRRDHAE
jgi:hypothetical protein